MRAQQRALSALLVANDVHFAFAGALVPVLNARIGEAGLEVLLWVGRVGCVKEWVSVSAGDGLFMLGEEVRL